MIFGDFDNSQISTVTVPQKSLNSIIQSEIPTLSRIDIMSLDIEGGELIDENGIVDLSKVNVNILSSEQLGYSVSMAIIS